MPLTKCTKDGKSGWKWGSQGAHFPGAAGRERALAVGRAIEAQKAEQRAVERLVGTFDADQLQLYIGSQPPLPNEAELLLKSLQDDTMEELSLIEKRDQIRGVKKFDDELQVVWGEVYIPDVPDAQGDFMTKETIRKMAWRFMASGQTAAIDLNHDNKTKNGAVLIESFVARDDDSIFIPGSWVGAVHIPDVEVWKKVKDGEITGFSIEATVKSEETEVEFEVPDKIIGRTSKSDIDYHDHMFVLHVGDDGQIRGITTSDQSGHTHEIVRGSLTEETNGHRHVYSFMDQVTASA